MVLVAIGVDRGLVVESIFILFPTSVRKVAISRSDLDVPAGGKQSRIGADHNYGDNPAHF